MCQWIGLSYLSHLCHRTAQWLTPHIARAKGISYVLFLVMYSWCSSSFYSATLISYCHPWRNQQIFSSSKSSPWSSCIHFKSSLINGQCFSSSLSSIHFTQTPSTQHFFLQVVSSITFSTGWSLFYLAFAIHFGSSKNLFLSLSSFSNWIASRCNYSLTVYKGKLTNDKPSW